MLVLALSGCGLWKKNKDPDAGGIDSSEQSNTAGSDNFIALCGTLGESTNKAVIGRDGWLFAADEMREIGKTGNISAASHREVVACITDYHHQLRKAGIELIVAPIPQKAIVYSEDAGARRARRLDSYLLGLYEELGTKGVRVIDLVPDLRRERKAAGGVYPKTASHLSPAGAEIVARAIAGYAKDRRWAQSLEPDPNIVGNPMQITLLGNLAGYARGDDSGQEIAPESLPIRAIGRRTVNGVIPASRSGDGRIILITSDQEGLAYGAPGMPAGYDADLRGSLADQLIYEFGTPIDVYSHSTSGANTARLRLLRASMEKPAVLSNTQAIIWAFSANELTRPGWRKVPLDLALRQSEETIGRDTGN